MPPKHRIDKQLNALTEAFARDVIELVRCELPRLVEQALVRRGSRSKSQPGRKPEARRRTRHRKVELTSARRAPGRAILDRYERMAMLRAIAECGGSVPAAGKLLGLARSTIYRRLHELELWPEIKAGQVQPAAEDPLVESRGPITLSAYERLAYVHALELAGGDRLRAADLLGKGKSTIYRKVQELQID